MMSPGSKALLLEDLDDENKEEKSILKDIKDAFDSGVHHDIRIVCSDGVAVTSSKYFLAIRVPFFEEMFFGGFQNNDQDVVDLKSCDSQTLTYVLEYVWKGTLELKHLTISTLLNIMETSRLLCIDSLLKGIESHLVHRINGGEVDISECFGLLEFAASNKFDMVLESLLVHFDRNWDSTDTSSRIESLSMVTVMALLMGDFGDAIEDIKFKVFFKWIKKNEVDATIKLQMIDAFDLKKISNFFLRLTDTVKTLEVDNYLKDCRISDLERRLRLSEEPV